jgi:glycosyltransferase involved in cell wall biosynthesis
MVNKFLYPRAGAETYMLTLGEQLRSRGHEVAYFGMEHPSNIPLDKSYLIPNLEFGAHKSTLEQVRELGRAAWHRFSKKLESSFSHCINDFKPDLVHAHNVYNQLPRTLFSSISGQVPVVMTVHDYHMICPNYSLYRQGNVCKKCVGGDYYHGLRHRCLQGRTVPSAVAVLSMYAADWKGVYETSFDRFICPSDFMSQRLIEAGVSSDKLVTIHNFAPLGEQASQLGDDILYVGRLSQEKGLETLIRAHSAMAAPRPKLRIAGAGPEEASLRRLVEELKDSEVEWLGRIPPSRVVEELQKAALSVVPSLWYENCSISILESLAQGTPVVASRQGGNSELIEDGVHGRLFEAGDEADLCRVLEEATTNRVALEKMGQLAFDRAKTLYLPATHAARIEELYIEECRAGD